MSRKYMPWLRQVTHAGITAENLAVPLRGQTAPLPEELSDICYVAVGATVEAMTSHLDRQRNSTPWKRQWVCDPANPDAVKIIAFAYPSVAERAISIYSEFGAPAVAVMKEDLPFLVKDFYHILANEDDAVAFTFGLQLGLVEKWLRQQYHDEIVQYLKDPETARIACWLLNERNKLFGRKVVVDIDELPWSIRVKEWDILPCKAVHRDGNAVFFEGEWKFMRLTNFWSRYCNPAMTPHPDLPDIWRLELTRANRPKEESVLTDDGEDLATFIY
jgi:hypothetical protein